MCLFIFAPIYALKNTIINNRKIDILYTIYGYMIYLYRCLALLIQGAPGTPGDAYLESLCGGIILHSNVLCLINIFFKKSQQLPCLSIPYIVSL